MGSNRQYRRRPEAGRLPDEGEKPIAETPAQRLNLADAKVLVEDCRKRYDWVGKLPPEEVDYVLNGLKERLIDVTITRSTNRELNHSLY